MTTPATGRRVWLITGATSGFGRSLAEEVLRQGDIVVGAAGKYRMTSGSAFSAANGARSVSRQRRISSRSVRMVSNRRPTGPA